MAEKVRSRKEKKRTRVLAEARSEKREFVLEGDRNKRKLAKPNAGKDPKKKRNGG